MDSALATYLSTLNNLVYIGYIESSIEGVHMPTKTELCLDFKAMFFSEFIKCFLFIVNLSEKFLRIAKLSEFTSRTGFS